MNDPIETAELLAFVKTIECRSMTRAALELGVPRATLSRRLARLEERLSARLIRRSTRRLVLSDAGEALYRHARAVLDAIARAEASVSRSDDGTVAGDLRVSVPPLLSPSLRALLIDFAVKHPAVRLHVHASGDFADVAGGACDVAIRAARDFPPGVIARTLSRDPVIAVAAPSYLRARGVPRMRRQLKDHSCLVSLAAGGVVQTSWPVRGGGRQHVDASFCSNEPTVLADAAARGLGIAMLPLFVVEPLIASGKLVHVLPRQLLAEARIAVVYAERELLPAAVRAFVDTVIAWAPDGFADRKAVLARCDSAGRATNERKHASQRSAARLER